MEDITGIMHLLSSKRVMERRLAVKMLKGHVRNGTSYMAALSLRYVAEHDPSYTVRNIARQALYCSETAPDQDVVWDKAYSFFKG